MSSKLGQEEFAQFLRRLSADHPGRRLLVMHGREAGHQGAAVEGGAREAQGRLLLQPLPAYSPELAP